MLHRHRTACAAEELSRVLETLGVGLALPQPPRSSVVDDLLDALLAQLVRRRCCAGGAASTVTASQAAGPYAAAWPHR